jgi:hypothetical protein
MERNIARQGAVVLVVMVALVCAAGVAWAQSPHFVGRVTATLLSNNDVQVCFKEAGLGDNEQITYVASASATATFVCVNNGGECPNAANKQTVSGPVSGTGTFSSGKNGSIERCIIIEGLEAPDFCPGGQTETLDLISYSSITITDTNNNVSETATPSSLSADPFDCPNP